MLPVYRDGDTIIVSPGADCRRGDRVVVKLASGEVTAKEVARLTADHLRLRPLNPSFEEWTVQRSEVEWMARIVWASQ